MRTFVDRDTPQLPRDRRHRRWFMCGLAGSLLSCLAASQPGTIAGRTEARASDQERERALEPREAKAAFELDEIVITATRTEKSIFDVPATTYVLTTQDLAEAMFRTVPEALRDVPGVMVQKTSHGQGSPFMRGFTGFRTLFMIDGIRLNNSVFRDGPNQYWNTVDPLSIKRLEIVKGPSSVLYGSDAIGGTVNAFTRGPDTYGEGLQWGGRVYYRYATAERSHQGRAEFSTTIDDRLGFYIGGSIKDFGDLEGGRDIGRQPRTGYDELDGDFKIEYSLSPDSTLIFAHQRVDLDNAERTHKTIFAKSFEGTSVGNELRRVFDQNRDLTYLQYHADDLGSFVDSARLSISYQTQAEQRTRIRSDGRRDHQGFDVDTFGVSAQFASPSQVGQWTYGVEYYRDEVDSFKRDFNADGTLNSVSIQGPIGDDATYDLLGIYVQNEIAVSEAMDVILGGRFTYASADAQKVTDPVTGNQIAVSESFDAFVGSARFLYRLGRDEKWNLFGGASQGFRAPNLSDLTRFDTARTNEIQTASTDLDPERFISYEIGVKTTQEKWAAQASYFYTDIEDLITRQPTGNIIDGANEVKSLNSGSGFVQGIELGTHWRFHPNFTAFGSFAWLEGEVDTFPTSAPVQVREPISRLMPATGQLGLRWDAPDRAVWVEGLITIADRQDKLSTRDAADTQRIPPGGTPGYAVLTIRGGWEIRPDLTLTLAVENITNEDYRIHGSGVNEPGTNVVLGIDWRF